MIHRKWIKTVRSAANSYITFAVYGQERGDITLDHALPLNKTRYINAN
jgi:hypothetical protein